MQEDVGQLVAKASFFQKRNKGGNIMEIFIPGNIEEKIALQRTTHLALAAHQDDIEIMAYDGILKCFGKSDAHFTGVVVTNGAGSPRSGIYGKYTDKQMQEVRKDEQKKAAIIGDYSAQIFLDYSSSAVKSPINTDVITDIKKVVEMTQPKVIYTHNLADKHDTHVAVAVKVIKALRELNYIPEEFYGCEVWRNLDWLSDENKILFDVSGHSNLENALLGVFDSQIAGGKRYDLATAGRRLANATYSASHNVDQAQSVCFAMDLLPLLKDHSLDIKEFILTHIDNFAKDVAKKVGMYYENN